MKLLPKYVLRQLRVGNIISIAEKKHCSWEHAEQLLKQIERDKFFLDQAYPITEYLDERVITYAGAAELN